MTNLYKSLLGLLLFTLMGCGGGNDCEIGEIEVSIGDCSCEDSYALTIDFDYSDAPSDMYSLYTRNDKLVGYYKLTDLPLSIEKFQLSGLAEDYIKICLDENEECCKEFEFIPPECNPIADCGIFDLVVEVGECSDEESYEINIDFEYVVPGNDFFDLFIRNNELLSFHRLDQLPLTLDNFPVSGNDYDFLKVCINDSEDCCQEIEFMPPECNDECRVFDLVAEIGPCTSDSTYNLIIDFEYENPGNDFFDLFVRNEVLVDFFQLKNLPITIENFEMSGNDEDFIRVCINDNPDCCQAIEFIPPSC